MSTWAEVENNVIRFVITASDNYVPPKNSELIWYIELTGSSPMPDVGWIFNGTVFEAPPLAKPEPDIPAPVDPPLSLKEQKRRAKAAIDVEAALARARHTTVIYHQGMVYLLKSEQAQAFKDDGYPSELIDNYPWIKEESVGLNQTYQETADSILTLRSLWTNIIGPAIERERLKGKKGIDKAKKKNLEAAKMSAITNLQRI